MDLNTLRVSMTVVSFVVFAGIVLWAVAPANRKAFQEAARIPLDDDDITPAAPVARGARHG